MNTALLHSAAKNSCKISQPKYMEWRIRDTFHLFNTPREKGSKLTYNNPSVYWKWNERI
jgi:hypothetical protein